MLRWLTQCASNRGSGVTKALAEAADSTALAIPRYPPFLQGLPAVPAAQVLTTQAALIERLQQALGFPATEFDQWVQPAIRRYAAPYHDSYHRRGR